MVVDLKAENCFLDSCQRAKVADFGSGKVTVANAAVSEAEGTGRSNQLNAIEANEDRFTSSVSRTLTGHCGSLLWMAPEMMLRNRAQMSLPLADVYSYGGVLFEIWTRTLPWEEIDVSECDFVEELQRRLEVGCCPEIPTRVADPPVEYAALMGKCWSTDPSRRPSFAQMVDDDIPRMMQQCGVNQ